MADPVVLSSYELERIQRIEANKRRLQELELPQMVEELQQAGAAEQPAKKKRRPADKPAEALEPSRRSKRTEGKERPCYVFEQERGSGGSRPPRDGPLVKEGECEEVYGAAHVLALGSTDKEWEMFTDGYNSGGERIYDSDKGLSCHQCRQKTLGQRTSCSRCKSGVGVLCGDCLFARYGEHVEEAAANKAWVCPCCRDLCNCSRHRKLRKWEATGQLHRSVKSRGYLSVAHYLVLNKAGGLEGKRAALASGFCPPELAEKLEREIRELEAAAAAVPPASDQRQAQEEEALAVETQEQAQEGAKAGTGKRRKPAGGATAGAKPKTAAAGGKKQKHAAAEAAAPGGKKQMEGSKKKEAGGGKKRGRPAKAQPAASPAGSPAAAAGVLQTSSGGAAMAPTDAGAAPAAEVAAVDAAVAAVVAAAAEGKANKGQKGSAGLPGAATLEEVVLAAPARRRHGRNQF